jgi:hypothetical protein
MGRPIRLKDSPAGRYTGGLDRTSDIDGKFALYWHDHLTQVAVVAVYKHNTLHRIERLCGDLLIWRDTTKGDLPCGHDDA